MRFRTKVFIIWSATVLIPLAAVMLPLQLTLRSSFDRITQAAFAGTAQSLGSLQAERVSRMKQAAALVMSIPELRALIAEHNVELSSENLSSLQERLDSLREVVEVSFICVMDGEGTLIAQNHNSPWPTLAQFREYAAGSPQAHSMVQRLLGVGVARTGQQGLWDYRGRIYQVVGIPLMFGTADADHPAASEGGLLMAVPLSDEVATKLGESHESQVTFLAEGKALASSLPKTLRADVTALHEQGKWPLSKPFDLVLEGESYHSLLQPLVDDCTGIAVGQMLIQSSSGLAEAIQAKLRQSLIVTMLISLLIALTTSYLLSGAVTRPVRDLVKAAKSVAAGDLNVSLHTRRRDELGALAVAFNDMVAGLQRQRELKTLVEESQASSKAKSQFLANMSHEIRTPLHGVIGMADLLLRTELSTQQRRYVGLVKSSAEVLTTLINDILDFSKIEAGKLELEMLDFNLSTLIDDIVELMSGKAEAKGLKLVRAIDPDLPALTRGDPTRIRQILLNLVSNSLKFTAHGQVTVGASRQTSNDDPIRVRLEVSDTGIGIPADRVDRLFKSFSQVDASTTRRYGGTGLGLAICKQLVELMGGEIGVESHPGTGSTFWLTIPLAASSAEANGQQQLVGVPQLDIRKNVLKVLLAEDQEVNQIVATELLSQAGYQCEVVTDGRAAVDAVIRTTYDVVLMDCQMPVMDGFEAATAIRQWEQEAKDAGRGRVPIIALTANVGGEDRQRCVQAGMDAHCGKPFSSRQLLDAITAVVAGRSQQQQSSPISLATDREPASTLQAAAEAVISPPLDSAAVLKRCSGKASLAAIVLEKFEKQANDAVSQLTDSIAKQDAQQIARVAHAIKGTAGLVSAEGLRSLAARMEDIGRNQALNLAEECLEQLRTEVQRCSEYIEQARTASSSASGGSLKATQ